jgi:hypothetical protein
MTSLSDVTQQLKDRKARLEVVRIPSDKVHMTPEGLLVVSDRQLPTSTEAQLELATYAGIPSVFFTQCPPDLQAVMFNKLFPIRVPTQDIPCEMGVAILDNKVISVASSHLESLASLDVLELVLDEAPKELRNEESLVVDRFHLNGWTGISLTSPSIKTEPRPGDIIQAGVDFYHSDAGSFATQVSTYLLRLVCKNGALVRVCEHDRGVRIRRDSHIDRDELIRRARRMAALAWSDLDKKLEVLKQLANERVENPREVIEKISADLGLNMSGKLIDGAIRAMGEDEYGNARTLLDIWNAMSRLATHSIEHPLAWRRRMMFASGGILQERIERCPQCLSILRHPRG